MSVKLIKYDAAHRHRPAITARYSGLVEDTCRCGAYRITWPSGRVDDWHACAWCVPAAAGGDR